jgi:hypothetical protein
MFFLLHWMIPQPLPQQKKPQKRTFAAAIRLNAQNPTEISTLSDVGLDGKEGRFRGSLYTLLWYHFPNNESRASRFAPQFSADITKYIPNFCVLFCFPQKSQHPLPQTFAAGGV